MTKEEFNAKTLDTALVPYEVDKQGNRVPTFKRADYQVTELVASGSGFSIGKTAAGKFVCLWPGHADLFDTLEDAQATLNAVEKASMVAAS